MIKRAVFIESVQVFVQQQNKRAGNMNLLIRLINLFGECIQQPVEDGESGWFNNWLIKLRNLFGE
jgi:hypothetical protein